MQLAMVGQQLERILKALRSYSAPDNGQPASLPVVSGEKTLVKAPHKSEEELRELLSGCPRIGKPWDPRQERAPVLSNSRSI